MTSMAEDGVGDNRSPAVEELGNRTLPVSATGHQEGPNMPTIRSEEYGELYAPETLSDLVGLLEAYANAGRNVVAWRGQEDVSWYIDPTVARRLQRWQPEFAEAGQIETSVKDYEKRLLDEARLLGHGFRDGRKLSDLELLSILRHYGAATRLMDFTRNAFVALWFATRFFPEKLGTYGLLIGVDPRPGQARRIRTEEHLNTSLKELIEKKEYGDQYLLWEPRYLFDRMRVQQSMFVLGPVQVKTWGTAPFGLTIAPDKVPEELVLIAVSPSLKQQMTDVDGMFASWRSLFGYEERYMFPDIEGYSGSHAVSTSFSPGFFADPRFEGDPGSP